MRLILDNVETGLITIDLDGRMSSECSHVVEQWFGAPVAGQKLSDWLGERDANYGEWLELALDSVKEGALPADVALGQFPASLTDHGKTYAVHYQLITNADRAPEKILVVVTDITERLRKEAAERAQAELLQLFQHIRRDKSGFIEFLTEAEGLMRALRTGQYDDVDHMKRIIHPLNGNGAIFGMRRVSEICHTLENQIAEEGQAPSPAQLGGLHEAWALIRGDLEKMLGEQRQSSIEIDDADYEAIIKAVLAGVDARIVTRMIESWRLEPAGRRLARIEQQIRGLCERMGKSTVTVAIEPHDLRFSSEHFAPFWSAFIHVLRNAVDHGVEDGEVRRQHGKPEQSLITVSTRVEGEHFVVTVEDDGPGVDWEALREKATELGLAKSVVEKTENLIFLPGVSSKKTVTELSGRGVGMAAVRDACQALGGTVQIDSRRGAGTRVSFVLPRNQAVYEGHAAMLRRARRMVTA